MLEDGFWSSKEVEKVALTFIHQSEALHAPFYGCNILNTCNMGSTRCILWELERLDNSNFDHS